MEEPSAVPAANKRWTKSWSAPQRRYLFILRGKHGALVAVKTARGFLRGQNHRWPKWKQYIGRHIVQNEWNRRWPDQPVSVRVNESNRRGNLCRDKREKKASRMVWMITVWCGRDNWWAWSPECQYEKWDWKEGSEGWGRSEKLVKA